MKVGFIAPLSIAAVNGGVRTQALKTAEALSKLGVEIEFISPWQESIDVDLVHVFSASPETLGIITRCSEQGIPIFLSPVFYSNRTAQTIAKALKIEETVGKIGTGIRSEFGIKTEACRLVSKILPNTSAEAALIEQGFGIEPSKLSIIPNGVELRFEDATPKLFRDKYDLENFILFVGQAGAKRKNVWSLLEVAKKLEHQIVIIGSFNKDAYGKKCVSAANELSNVLLIETLPHDSELLASAYASCHTFILPSMFETPGIAAMEAALAGANIVITEKGGTKDYFGEYAEYVNPIDLESIQRGLEVSLVKPKSLELKEHIRTHFKWDNVGKLTLKEYNRFLDYRK